MRINTNVGAMQAARNLGTVENAIKSSSEKLSSGFRINRAADDAAGLGIANVLRSDIRAYTQASRNAEQANSVYNIAEGAAQSVQTMLERMKELASQSASDSVDTSARARIDKEFQALKSEIDRTVSTTKFQGNALLNGSFGATVDSASAALATGTGVYGISISGTAVGTYTLSENAGDVTLDNGNGVTQTITAVDTLEGGTASLSFSTFGVKIDLDSSFTAAGLDGLDFDVNGGTGTFLIGASGDYAGQDSLTINGSSLDLTTNTLTVNASSVTSLTNAQSALAAIDVAIGKVNTALGEIGAGQSRIENAISNLKTIVQNFSAAESTIRDVDMADEMVKYSKNQILAQAGTAMLAQANQSGQGVLQLFR
ncbi:MAG TPA: flagellin [Gemmatimonadaceae bacterium]|nr:flagellin [Gemmatimonadaceae bacterium]